MSLSSLINKSVIPTSQTLMQFARENELTGTTSNIAIAYWARVAAFKLLLSIDDIECLPAFEAFKEHVRSFLTKKRRMDNDGIRSKKIAMNIIKQYAWKLYYSAKNPTGNEKKAVHTLGILLIILNQFGLSADLFIIRSYVLNILKLLRTRLEKDKHRNPAKEPSNSTQACEMSTRIKKEVPDTTALEGEVVENSGEFIISTDNGKRQRDGGEDSTQISKKIKNEHGQSPDGRQHSNREEKFQEDNNHKQVIIISSRTSGIMTKEEIDSVRQHLLDTMINFMSGPNNAQSLQLRFKNSERVEPGWFQVTTEDEETARWLLEKYTPDALGEVNFRTIKAIEAPWPKKIGFYLKSQEVDLTRVIKMLGLQNGDLNVSRWKHVCSTKVADGWFVNFVVEQEDATRLEALGWALFFELGTLAVMSLS